MADTVKVNVTMFEDPIEVPADEVGVLRAQGLLREDPQAAAAAPVSTDPAPAAKSAPKTPKDA